jgi:hypothetical protein
MRGVAEVRARAVKILAAMLTRPSVYATGQAFEATVTSQLADIAYIDDEDDKLAGALAEMRKNGCSGERGAWGVLASTNRGECTEAVASIYARIAALLGAFEPLRRLGAAEWREAATGAAAWARSSTRSRADVEACWGPPSYRVTHQWPGVLAYAGPTDDAWLYFDFVENNRDDALCFVRLPEALRATSIIDVRPPRIGREPEDVYRAFRSALLGGDEQHLRSLIVAHPDPSVLWKGAYPRDVAAPLDAQQVGVARLPTPSNVVYIASDDLPMPLALVSDGATWRVDADPVVMMWSRPQ